MLKRTCPAGRARPAGHVCYTFPMVAIQIPDELAQQIQQAAQRAGETQDVFLREAVQSRLDDLEDVAVATERLQTPGRRLTLNQVKNNLGLDD